jgi:hypothetical protein
MKALFPYPTLFGDITSGVSRITVDGEPLSLDRLDPTRRQIDLAELERLGWRTAALTVDVRGPGAEIEQLAAEDRHPIATVVVHCGPTNARRTIGLSPNADEPGRWTGRLDLDRADWFGRISLRSVVTATVEGIPGRIVGEGDEWTIALDDLPRPPVTGALTVKWEEFATPTDDSLSFLRAYEQEPLFLRLDPDAPILYLNKGFDGLFHLLQDRRRRPSGEHALHDETRGSIAAEVWFSLFNASLQSIERVNDEDNEERSWDWPAAEWQKTVLELILDRMYPEKTSEDALHEVVTALDEPEGGTTVQQLALPAIATHSGATRLLRQAIAKIGADLHEDRAS